MVDEWWEDTWETGGVGLGHMVDFGVFWEQDMSLLGMIRGDSILGPTLHVPFFEIRKIFSNFTF